MELYLSEQHLLILSCRLYCASILSNSIHFWYYFHFAVSIDHVCFYNFKIVFSCAVSKASEKKLIFSSNLQ